MAVESRQSPTRTTGDDDGSLPLEQPPSFVAPVQTVLRLPWNEASVKSRGRPDVSS
jgi:hypothetical protein